MADTHEQPKLSARSRGRTRRWILIAVGGLLVGFGALLVLVPVDGADEGRSCGGAPAVAAAVALDTAAEGDGGWCRSEGRSALAVGVLVFVLPGVFLLRWQGRAARRAGLADPDAIGGSPRAGKPDWSASPRDGSPGGAAPSGVVPDNGGDLYLDVREARRLLLLAPMAFPLPPLMWVAVRASMLGLKRRPVLTLDDTGLTDHRYGLKVPWRLLRSVTLVGAGTQAHIAIDVNDLRPLRPSWRLGSALRWSAWRLASSSRRIRLPARGIDGIAAFVDQAAARIRPVPALLPDRLVLYRWSWWLAGLPGGLGLLVLLLHMYLNPGEGLGGDHPVLIPGALWLLWRGVSAVRGRPLLIVDREGITDRRRPTFHATWDDVEAVEFVPGKQNQLLVRLRNQPGAPQRSDRDGHASPTDRRLGLDGFSTPAHEIAHVAYHLHAGPRDGVATYSPATVEGRPNRVAAGAAIATAIIVAGIGWHTRPSGDLESGDCYRKSSTKQLDWSWVPCDQPHEGEIFLVLDHPAGDAARFPGNYSLSGWANVRCDPAFKSYVGHPEPAADGLTYEMRTPTGATWTEGDRHIVCAVVSNSGEQLSDRASAS